MNKDIGTPAGFNVRPARDRISRAENDSFCLPEQVIAVVPSCALPCLQSFAQLNYDSSSCSDLSNLNYLCTETTSQGPTIGEAALQCVVSSCGDLGNFQGYNVCTDIPGAMANTATLITATVTSLPLTSLPASVGMPSSIQQVTSIVTASGIPPILLTVASSAPTSPTTNSLVSQSTTTRTSASVSTPSNASTASLPLNSASAASTSLQKTKLKTSSIIGIAAGAGGFILIAFGLFLYWYCNRRKAKTRRRSNRWSTHIPTGPAPTHHNPKTTPSGTAMHDAAPSNHNQTQRYYSKVPPQAMEEKRRSFWRKSIKPEDIGVAVSPDVNNESPMSFSSQRSTDKLLPNLPNEAKGTRVLWPAPLNIQTNKHTNAYSYHHTSMSTIFDEDDPQRFSLAPVAREVNVADNLLPTMVATRAGALKTLQISNGSPTMLKLTHKRQGSVPYPARIPLTPTYDNGNYIGTPYQTYPPSSYPGLNKNRNHNSEATNDALPRRILFSKYAANDTQRGSDNEVAMPSSSRQSTGAVITTTNPGPELIRNNSDTTAGTEIEDTPTPGEAPQQLRNPSSRGETMQQRRLSSRKGFAVPQLRLNSTRMNIPELDQERSPISRLKYPAIPRSAAISSQAEVIAQRAAHATPDRKTMATSNPTIIPLPSVQSSQGSSEHCASDSSIEFPTPPAGNRSLANQSNQVQKPLREVVNRANLQLNRVMSVKSTVTGVSADAESVVIEIPRSVLQRPAQMHLQTPQQRLPLSKVRVTPRKDQSGDLYLTVEI